MGLLFQEKRLKLKRSPKVPRAVTQPPTTAAAGALSSPSNYRTLGKGLGMYVVNFIQSVDNDYKVFLSDNST